MTRRTLVSVACALIASACGGGSEASTGAGAGPAARFDLVTGDAQSAVVGTDLPNALVVRVTDAQNRPVPGQVVNFVVTAGGGHPFAGAANTNGDGLAQERWTLGTTAGAQTLEVRSVDAATGQPRTWATFHATATPGAARAIVISAGDNQSGTAGLALTSAITAKVSDQYGNPVSGIVVAWAAVAGGGSLAPPTSTTDAAGIAQSTWTLGGVAGANGATATVTGIGSVTFQATGTTGAAGRISVAAGDAQTGIVGDVLATQLRARVTDANGNPVTGATVAWATPAGSGSLGNTTTTSDASGIALASWTLGTTSGAMLATATVTGAGTATFHATATAGAVARMVNVSGGGQTALVTTTLPQPFVAQVIDRFGNPVSGATVTWTVLVPSSATLSAMSTVSDAAGMVSSRATLGTRAGSNQATAEFNGLTTIFGWEATGGPPAALVKATDRIVDVAGGQDPIVVVVRDVYGNGVEGALVTWSVLSGGGSVAPSSSLSGTGGDVYATWTLGTVAGANSVVASVNGISATITGTGLRGDATQLVMVSGDGQTATAGSQLPGDPTVRAFDQYGNAVPFAIISWSTLAGGGSLSSVSSATLVGGTASTHWTLGPASGAYSIVARLASTTAQPSVTFNASATAGSPSAYRVNVLDGDGQRIRAGGRFTTCSIGILTPVTVEVTTPAGAPVSGVTVNFSGEATTADAVGRASGRPFACNQTYGVQGFVVNVGSGAATAVFTSFVTASGSGLVATLAPSGQTGRVNTELPQPLVLSCYDINGGPSTSCGVTLLGPGGLRLVPERYPPGQTAYYWLLGPQLGTQTVQAIPTPNTATATATP